MPSLFNEVSLISPKEVLFDPSFMITKSKLTESNNHYVPDGYFALPLKLNTLLTPAEYDRDIR